MRPTGSYYLKHADYSRHVFLVQVECEGFSLSEFHSVPRLLCVQSGDRRWA
jgi:hypothetical protein